MKKWGRVLVSVLLLAGILLSKSQYDGKKCFLK